MQLIKIYIEKVKNSIVSIIHISKKKKTMLISNIIRRHRFR